jgi:hypothetical protein
MTWCTWPIWGLGFGVFTFTHTHTHTHRHTDTHTCMSILYIYMYIYTHICTYLHMYTHTHTHTHTHRLRMAWCTWRTWETRARCLHMSQVFFFGFLYMADVYVYIICTPFHTSAHTNSLSKVEDFFFLARALLAHATGVFLIHE